MGYRKGAVKEGAYRVVDACAMMFPPMGFFSFPA